MTVEELSIRKRSYAGASGISLIGIFLAEGAGLSFPTLEFRINLESAQNWKNSYWISVSEAEDDLCARFLSLHCI
jgi:hypothetical protein